MEIDLDAYKRLVTFGCSWTAGDEINDHKCLGKSFEQTQFEKLHSKNIHEFHNKKNEKGQTYWSLIKKNEHLNRNRAWGYHLSKKLHYDFLNFGKSGSSIDHALWQMIFETKNGTLRDDDLIIFGLTTPTRVFVWGDTYMKNEIIGNITDKKLANLFHYYWTDNNLLFSCINSLNSILAFRKDILVFWIRHNPFEEKHSKVYGIGQQLYKIDMHNRFFYDRTYELYKERFFSDNILLELPPREHCGFGHPQEKQHLILANKMFKDIVDVKK